LNSSLSVLIPVHNAQASLHATLQRVLDVLPELTHRFEVVVIDDGSNDATCEVAYDFARDYPQVTVFRNATHQGWATAVTQSALRATSDFVMIHCGGALLSDDIVGLWRLREGIAAAAIAKAKAAQTGRSLRIDGRAVSSANVSAGSTDFTLGGVGIHARAQRSNLLLVHRQQLGQLERTLSAIAATNAAAGSARPPHRNLPSGKSPNILNRLKSLAWGE
jgi:hypothetical protein